ncbi:bifunctional histidinol-phosphatase/imidazoleglycerol-phosphate dehydratase HisB [Taibaiella soli]|uniref:Histidine biosynthesis bifunctional protein HisB n=1 Tax=Taibaiella soli TaxID=1649169 RepID=A0A2W2AK34_9BACT|nr:bifunctional histidinol-phosphatase/imidazoleglycerol-phosphate dehydratase HisB [Taibaiella soli]PZF73922.1 bifunctional histidinol-phosphatase/imidazoleglycerol-phosphate dehydratase [Taibaiella soli]
MKKVLFIDRDGTIIDEPKDTFQVDTLEQLRFLPGALRNLYQITQQFSYELVMVTNQDGLGTDKYPQVNFDSVQAKMIQILEDERIFFSAVYVDSSFPEEGKDTRKPGIGMLREYLDGTYDLQNSYVIGDRLTDVQLAENLGAKSILILNNDGPEGLEGKINCCAKSWDDILGFLQKENSRFAVIHRKTNETDVRISLNLDGVGKYHIDTGLGFFDHMLEQLAKHGKLDLQVTTKGDLHIDEHHTIEDTAIALGEAFRLAMGDKMGMERYGFCLPMDDCLALVSLDFSGRSWLQWNTSFKRERIGDVPTEMLMHFFKSFCDGAGCNLYVRAKGENEHHKIESIFKAFGRSIRRAVKKDKTDASIPTTKGVL